jgi:hypothetical protein
VYIPEAYLRKSQIKQANKVIYSADVKDKFCNVAIVRHVHTLPTAGRQMFLVWMAVIGRKVAIRFGSVEHRKVVRQQHCRYVGTALHLA